MHFTACVSHPTNGSGSSTRAMLTAAYIHCVQPVKAYSTSVTDVGEKMLLNSSSSPLELGYDVNAIVISTVGDKLSSQASLLGVIL